MTGRSQHGHSESVVAPLPCDKATASGEVGHSKGSWLGFATSHSAAPHNTYEAHARQGKNPPIAAFRMPVGVVTP